METTTTPPPKFDFIDLKKPHQTSAGGAFLLTINGQKVCEYITWGFSSCGVDLLQNFKAYTRDYTCPTGCDKTNWELFEEHHVALFEWLRGNAPTTSSWKPQEFLMLLAPLQVTRLPTLLSHPCVKEVDHWNNKSHGGNKLSLFRISLNKDFK